ncbi:MAG: type 1 glutamine amidotransferase domain-containing protein [Bifidobacteriaceae bacterium]|jgi:putative intracellular protease/amidase|nr:type 1 glutamine amidotransferase domain-containing protein [Bifidobacteriaceae bacterium]
MSKKVLVVLTSADAMPLEDGSMHPTGFWAEEFIVAYRGLVKAGLDVTIATPGGKPAPADPGSLTKEMVGAEASVDYKKYLASIADVLEHPMAISDVTAGDYDAIVMPGGHGPMVDLAADKNMGHLLERADAAGKIIAPFCHGPAGLFAAKKANGNFLFAGRTMTSFTDREEKLGGVQKIGWYLASCLKEMGVNFIEKEPFTSHVEIDGNLISGQNPQSSKAVTEAVIAALR